MRVLILKIESSFSNSIIMKQIVKKKLIKWFLKSALIIIEYNKLFQFFKFSNTKHSSSSSLNINFFFDIFSSIYFRNKLVLVNVIQLCSMLQISLKHSDFLTHFTLARKGKAFFWKKNAKQLSYVACSVS